jgi:DNA polymerase-1
MPQNPRQTLYIIDAHGFLHRYYHALPKLTSSSGEEVGALYGFMRLLLRILREKKPSHMAVCFDSPGKTFRHGLYADYKANRKKTDDALVTQLSSAREITSVLGLAMLAGEGLEADDLMACAVRGARSAGMKAVIVTSDKDVMQLVGDGVEVWPGDQQGPRGEAYVRERYGVEANLLPDYFALVGDASDNVPGVAGIGPKMAAKLVSACGTLENILKKAHEGDAAVDASAAKKLLAHEQDALLSKKLVTLHVAACPDADIETLKVGKPDPQKLADMSRRLDFRDLMTLAQAGAANASFTNLPKQADWDATLAKLPQAKEAFFQAIDGCALAGLSPEEFAAKPMEDLTEADRAAIAAFIANPSAIKIGHYIKEALRAAQISTDLKTFPECFDTALAAYCMDPSRGNYDFAALASEYCGTLVAAAKPPESLILQNLHIWKLRDELSSRLKEENLDALYRGMEMPLLWVLLRMEQAGVAVNTEYLKQAGVELAAKMGTVQTEINALAGAEINVNSPKQLSSLLFERLGLKPVKKTKTGYSTDEEVLEALAPAHRVPALILQYREAAKLNSTYVSSLLELASEGRVHTRFDQTGTATGRLSSLHPNLQNIPVRSESGRAIRRAFVAGEGCVLLSADYSQIDLRVLAHESGDPALCEAFNAGGDIHTRTAAEVFKMEPLLVSSDMRRAAKAINFGIVYGQSATGLSMQLGISRSEAQKYIDHYFETYKGVREWTDSTIVKAKEQGFVRTMSGRIRRLPDLASSNGGTVAFAQRAAVNTVIQGGSSDVIKKAMLEVYKLLENEKARMTLQVHDELVFEIPAGDVERLAPSIKEIMEGAYKLRVPLVAELKAGPNWAEMKPMAGDVK